MNLSNTEVSDAVDGPLPERARLESAGARWQSLTGCLLIDEMRQSQLLLAAV